MVKLRTLTTGRILGRTILRFSVKVNDAFCQASAGDPQQFSNSIVFGGSPTSIDTLYHTLEQLSREL